MTPAEARTILAEHVTDLGTGRCSACGTRPTCAPLRAEAARVVATSGGLPVRRREVNVFADGAGLRIEPIAGDALEERDDRLVVAPSGLDVNDEMVRALRDEPHTLAYLARRTADGPPMASERE